MANTIADGDKCEMFQKETKTFTFTITDDDGNPRDLSASTGLRFVVHDSNDPATYKGKVEQGAMDVTGAAGGVIGVPVGSPISDNATREWHWRLWDTTGDDEVLAHGPFKVHPALSNSP